MSAPDIRSQLERSSLGTAGARKARRSVSDDVARTVVARAAATSKTRPPGSPGRSGGSLPAEDI